MADTTTPPTIEQALAERDDAYAQRDRLAALLARLALHLAGPLCAEPGWSALVAPHAGPDLGDEWKRVVVVETPEGQLSWHFPEREGPAWFDGLPASAAPVWDGHTTDQKHARIERLIARLDAERAAADIRAAGDEPGRQARGVLRSGRAIGSLCELNPSVYFDAAPGSLIYGHDGKLRFDDPPEWRGAPIHGQPLTADERAEIAAFCIARWRRWAATGYGDDEVERWGRRGRDDGSDGDGGSGDADEAAPRP